MLMTNFRWPSGKYPFLFTLAAVLMISVKSMKISWINKASTFSAFRPLQSVMTKTGEINADTSFSIRTSSVASMKGKLDEKDTEVLRPLVVCGPSGVGKGTIIANYMEKYPFARNFGFTTSHTTRLPRPGERDGIEYYFTTIPDMKEAIAEGKFIESAEVHGNLYGTSFEALQNVQHDENKFCLLDIDIQGVKNIKDHEKRKEHPVVQGHFVFIAPPSMEILESRLKSRGTESPESVQRRTENAKLEMEYGMEDGNFDHIVVNGELEQACKDFDRVVKELYSDLL